MTAQQKAAIRVGVVTTVIGGMLMIALSAMAGQVVLRPEFDSHVQGDTAWKREQRELTMEVVCELKPERRGCR